VSVPIHQPPGSIEKRLSLTPGGNLCYLPKTPYRDGTTHVIEDHGQENK
jgi:hypothetical protein